MNELIANAVGVGRNFKFDSDREIFSGYFPLEILMNKLTTMMKTVFQLQLEASTIPAGRVLLFIDFPWRFFPFYGYFHPDNKLKSDKEKCFAADGEMF